MIEIPGETEAFIDDLAGKLAEAVRELGRRGAVVAVSGGVDSGVVAALSVRALGPERVMCLRLPERDVGDSSSDLGLELAEMLGCATVEEPITGALEALGCYSKRDDAIRKVFEDYEPSWRHKLVRSPAVGRDDRLLARGRASRRDHRSAADARATPIGSCSPRPT